MSANTKLRDEMRFQQRWDFRRGDSDCDSSSNDSKYSLGGEPDHKRHKPVPSSVPVDNDETSKFQQKGSIDPAISVQTEIGKAVKGKRGRSKRENLNQTASGSRKVVRQKKSETNGNSNAALDDLKNHMNSLLEELKVTRKNLLSWMREEMKKLAAEEKASVSERKKDSLKGEEIPLQHQDNSGENARVWYQNLFGKNIEIPYQNNFEEHVHVQNPIKFEENVQIQNLINLEEDIEPQPQTKTQEKVQMQRNCTGSSAAAKNGNGKTYKRSNKSKKSTDCNNCTPELEHQIDYTHAIVLVKPEENGEKKLSLPEKSNFKSDPPDKNAKVQPQKSIVLGIRAQNCKDGTSAMKSAAKGKKAANLSNHCQVPDYQLDYSQAIAAEKNQVERSGLSFEPKFSSESFSQVASSMYLTLPSVLTKPHTANFRPDTPPFSYIQPRLALNQSGNSSERSNLMLGSSSHLGYFQPEERNRNYAQMSFRDISFFNQNSTLISSIGNGFTVPLHPGFNIPNQFDLENLPHENNNRPNLTMNGGSGSGSGTIRLSGGNYSLAESYNIANNFHIPSNYRADGRLVSYQDSNRFPK